MDVFPKNKGSSFQFSHHAGRQKSDSEPICAFYIVKNGESFKLSFVADGDIILFMAGKLKSLPEVETLDDLLKELPKSTQAQLKKLALCLKMREEVVVEKLMRSFVELVDNPEQKSTAFIKKAVRALKTRKKTKKPAKRSVSK
jgi:hypothetical protein